MAETLSFEQQTETTSVENLSEEEQDSLQVGQELRGQQEELLAGKYKDAAELEKAYVELEKKLGQSKSEPEEDSQDQSEAKEETEEKDAPSETTLLDDLWTESQTSEKFSDDTLKKLNDATPAELADMYLKFRSENVPRDLTDQDVQELKGIVGGDEQYGNMLEWANKNLNKQEIDMFDAVMEQGNPLAAFFAVRSLAYRYEDATGKEGRMVAGTAPKDSGDQFRSQAEVVQAMNDPRYEDDPAYRQDIMEKLRRSKVSFRK